MRRRIAPMHTPPAHEITPLLVNWRQGNETALAELLPIVYQELRKIADSYLRRERSDHTLQPTALINEAYLRLVDHENIQWQNRSHFFGLAARAMRRILVDHARSRNYQKRGGAAQQVSLDEAATLAEDRATELIALD